MSVLSLDSTIAVSEDTVYRELDEEAVILDLQSGTYFGLDPVGARMWLLLGEHGSLRRVFEILSDEYDVAPDTLARDILALVTELCGRGLTRVADAGSPS